MNEMRIYVASLSDYNNGRLEGKWFDLSDYPDASDLMMSIQEMLDDLTKKYDDGEVREEWAVHDYEGIPSTLASEYMGEQDFQKLYDIDIIAQEFGIPFEVLVERAGDTGVDDYNGYRSLADSLMLVVDGNDESDIVSEYEFQLGSLGYDFWSNHIYIDAVTERVMYGEDVDRFREDILYDNPDIDEAEAERQAEEMADEEADRREDLTTYLEDMGYEGEIPSFVSKDYEGAWKRSLSYDLDVIHHDGEMYVFSNNYSLGGTILSGMIGAYIGYKVGRAKPQKKGFETEKRIGRKIKGSFSKKKMAQGGGVDGNVKLYDVIAYKKASDFDNKTNGRVIADSYVRKVDAEKTLNHFKKSYPYIEIKEYMGKDPFNKFANGGGVDGVRKYSRSVEDGATYIVTQYDESNVATYRFDSLREAENQYDRLIDYVKEDIANDESNYTKVIALEGYVEGHGMGWETIRAFDVDEYLESFDDDDDDYAGGGGVDGKDYRKLILKKFINKVGTNKDQFVTKYGTLNGDYENLRLSVNVNEITDRQKIDLKQWAEEVSEKEFLDQSNNGEYLDFDGLLDLSKESIISLNQILNREFNKNDYYFSYVLLPRGYDFYVEGISYESGGGVNVGKYIVTAYDGKSAEFSLNKKGLKAKNATDVAYFDLDEANKFIEKHKSKYYNMSKFLIRERTFNDDVADYDDFVDRETSRKLKEQGRKMAKGGGIYSSDVMWEMYVYDFNTEEYVTTRKFRAKNKREAREIAEDLIDQLRFTYGNISYNLYEAPFNTEVYAKGGGISGLDDLLRG